MKKPKTCKSVTAFRTALEDRLKRVSAREGEALQSSRKQVSFGRLLARLFSNDDVRWVRLCISPPMMACRIHARHNSAAFGELDSNFDDLLAENSDVETVAEV